MDITPGVSVVTLTLPDRTKFLDRVRECVSDQTYQGQIEHIFVTGAQPIGWKRNSGCEAASYPVILMLDDDDIIEPDYIEKSLDVLRDADVTGLSEAYFIDTRTGVWYKYVYTGRQPYVIGSGMMFWRRVWERNRFDDDLFVGEDAKFLANAGKIIPNGLIESFSATIHGSNTASHMALPYMQKLS